MIDITFFIDDDRNVGFWASGPEYKNRTFILSPSGQIYERKGSDEPQLIGESFAHFVRRSLEQHITTVPSSLPSRST